MSEQRTAYQVRFFCTKHHQPLEVVGRDEVFSPTYGGPSLQDRIDNDVNGWLDFDTSELACPHHDASDCNEQWEIQVR